MDSRATKEVSALVRLGGLSPLWNSAVYMVADCVRFCKGNLVSVQRGRMMCPDVKKPPSPKGETAAASPLTNRAQWGTIQSGKGCCPQAVSPPIC